jgi:integrase
MSPRNRSKKNKGLEQNIKVSTSGKVTYYYYIFPDKSSKALGKDKTRANGIAKALNELRNNETQIVADYTDALEKSLVDRVGNVNTLVDEFIEHFLPEKTYAKSTLDGILIKLNQYRELWGAIAVTKITTRTITEYLNTISAHAYIKHRSLLIMLFKFSVAQGFRTSGMGNPAQYLMEKAEPKRIRTRHSLQGYKTIRDTAPDWLQRAMNVALYSLQRRGDITELARSQVNTAKRTITILQRKSRNWDEPVFIEIEMTGGLLDAVQDCMMSKVHCPYLIHYQPKRITKEIREAKNHPFSVTDAHLSKEFTRYRDLSGAYDHIPKEQRPTFHDLRALGSWLYQEAGYSQEYIQALTGHSNEKMLAHYQKGHAPVEPKLVQAGLKLEKI